jgi:NADPH:quinone reductase
MRAIQVTKLYGPAAMELVEMDEPATSRDMVIVDVEAADVSFPYVLLSRGLY